MKKLVRMMLMLAAVAALCWLTVAAPAAQSPQKAEVALKNAMEKESVDGNLKAAIEQYQKIVATYGSNRTVAAKALLRMAQCYEKLGAAQTQEAQKAYERIVREYADQKEAVAEAQKYLAEKAVQPEPGVTVKRIAASSDKRGAGPISRDGRYLAFYKDDGVYVHNLVTSEERRIVQKAAPYERFINALIFPDGKQVAYSRYLGFSSQCELHIVNTDGSNERLLARRSMGGKDGDSIWVEAASPDGKQLACIVETETGDYHTDLYILNADGSSQRLLYLTEKDEGIWTVEWSPDGKHLLAGFWTEKDPWGSRLLLISVADGSFRVIGSPSDGRFSPDGRFIAFYRYSFPDLKSKIGEGLYVAAVEGGKEVLLAPGAASKPIWTSDGKRIIFRNRRPDQSDPRNPKQNHIQEPYDLYSIRVADGKPDGKPELIKKDLVLPGGLLGAAPDGNLYYAYEASESRNIYIVNLDPATGKAVSKPERFNQKFIDISAGPQAWSPDGQVIAYSKWEDGSPTTLIIRSTKTGEERELILSLPLAPEGTPIQWFPDGSLLARGRVNGHWAFFKVDVQTGKGQMFFDRPQSISPWDEQGALSLDGKFLFYIACEPGTRQPSDPKVAGTNTLRLMRRNMENGDEKELYQAKSPSLMFNYSLKLSSDGRQLAFTIANLDNAVSCITVSVEGEAPREIYRSSLMQSVKCWMKDGRHILVSQPDPKSGMAGIWTVPTEGGQPVPTGITFPIIGNATLHPDGRRFTFVGRQPGQTELWVMKLLPPGPKP